MGESLREKILNGIGLGLLLLCFVISLGRIMWDRGGNTQEHGESVTIRFAHWQLEGGVREAFDEIAAAYMKLHPEVEVVQIPVPERIFQNWLITQLVGGTAPDIIQMGMGLSEDRQARFFVPSTEVADLPNPWNRGTELEGVPLRETFIDGMESCFNNSLLEYYGVPLSSYTVRMYYNLDLLHEITGSEELPATYGELVELSKKVLAYAAKSGQKVFPIAGSKYNSPTIMSRLFKSQTAGISRRVYYGALAEPTNFSAIAESAANGGWTLDDPEVLAGLKLMRDLGQYMQPGFLQLGRDDASFYFVQGKALMIATGSWDATSITSQADFRLGIGLIPVPAPGSEQGPYSEGIASDASIGTGVIMGLTRDCEHPEVALDFLLFMASQPMNQLWTDVSKWAPSVVGVVPDPQAKPFQPFFDGYLGGFDLNLGQTDTMRIISNATNRLVGPTGSVEGFLEAIRPDFLPAVEHDLVRVERNLRVSAQRSDTTLGALAWMALQDPGSVRLKEKVDLLSQTVVAGNLNHARTQRANNSVRKSLK